MALASFSTAVVARGFLPCLSSKRRPIDRSPTFGLSSFFERTRSAASRPTPGATSCCTQVTSGGEGKGDKKPLQSNIWEALLTAANDVQQVPGSTNPASGAGDRDSGLPLESVRKLWNVAKDHPQQISDLAGVVTNLTCVGDKDSGLPLEGVRKLWNVAKDHPQQISDLAGAVANLTGVGDGDRSSPLEAALKIYAIAQDIESTTSVGSDEEDSNKAVGMQLLSSLKRILGSNVEFIFKPTMDEGTDLGIALRLEWKKTNEVNKRKRCGLHTNHFYQGKIYLRNADKLVEPVVHIHSATQRWVERVLVAGRERWEALHRITAAMDERRKAALVWSLALLLLAALGFIIVQKFPH